MKQWQNIIRQVMTYGVDTDDRTGIGTRSVFGTMARWNLQEGFPAVTTKKLAWRAMVGELLWFMEGSTSVERLRDITYGPGASNKTIWDDNYNNQAINLGYSHGHLGPVYGAQWRGISSDVHGERVDQFYEVVEAIKTANKSMGRRLIVNSWNPRELPDMALPPCHYSFQFEVQDGKLSLLWIQRSVDVFLGLPFNIASYALLTHLVAEMCNLEVGDLIFQGGNTHIYLNHFDQCKEVLNRVPYQSPTLSMSLPEFFGEWTTERQLKWLENGALVDDFNLVDYNSYGALKAPMAV